MASASRAVRWSPRSCRISASNIASPGEESGCTAPPSAKSAPRSSLSRRLPRTSNRRCGRPSDVQRILMKGRVLIIAGSDSGGGAGIQADIKTVTMLDAFAMTAVTALTAQNTEGVFGVLPIPPAFIRQQIEVVLDDLRADASKTGQHNDTDVTERVP